MTGKTTIQLTRLLKMRPLIMSLRPWHGAKAKGTHAISEFEQERCIGGSTQGSGRAATRKAA
jgi:hypothetical protein